MMLRAVIAGMWRAVVSIFRARAAAWRRTRRGYFTRRDACDPDYFVALSATLSEEWLSPDDERAFGHL